MDNQELLSKVYAHLNVIVRSATKEALEQVSQKQITDSKTIEDFLSAEEAASFLKIKLNTVYSKVEKGELPHYRSGKRKLLFSKAELQNYISTRKGKSNDEITLEAEQYINSKKT